MDMLDSVHKATTYLADQSYSDFLADMKTQDAVVRNLIWRFWAKQRISYPIHHIKIPS